MLTTSCCDKLFFQVLKKFGDVVWHVSWSVTGNILAVSGGDNKVISSSEVRNAALGWFSLEYKDFKSIS